MSIFVLESESMNACLNVLYQLRLFSLAEAVEATKTSAGNIAKSLHRWQGQGLVRQVRRNLYCMNDIATGCPLANRYEIGSHVSPTAFIAYHSALEFHGLAHQPFYTVSVCSESSFKAFEFDGYSFTYHSAAIGSKGVVAPQGSPNVRVTNLERTLVDCFDKIERSGGIEEIAHCLESVVMVDENWLLEYLEAYGKAFLYQKTGYLLERIKEQARISDSFIALCREKGRKSVKWLTNNEQSDTYIKEWNLYVPQFLTDKAQSHELI